MTFNASTKFGGGGALNGVAPPIPFSGVGAIFRPHWAAANMAASGLTTTAGRLYYIPYYFPAAGFTYTGLKSYNTGAGDNGEVFRMGVYQASATTGMPSSLVADCGEVTLTGAAAERTLASSWTAPYKGWGWLAYHANTAADIGALLSRFHATDVGIVNPDIGEAFFGISSVVNMSYGSGTPGFGAVYVSTAYGALASTAVAPTNITSPAPVVAPYKT